MGTVPENRLHWGRYDWSQGGEEWSSAWGGSVSQWRVSLLPRIGRWLPASRVVEIGCGYGRWTRLLRPWCRELLAVDVASECVAACRDSFRADPGIRCALNDGRSLPGLEPGSVDFAFSFDSLVHAELDSVTGYLGELGRVLSADGAAFLHVSNFGAILAARPGSWNHHWRAESMSAAAFEAACLAAGLRLLVEEIVDWGGVEDCDCLATVVRPGSRWAAEPRRARNPHFMGEAHSAGIRARLYGGSAAPEPRPGPGPPAGGRSGGGEGPG
jgi:SAM-dependent methyltransferase